MLNAYDLPKDVMKRDEMFVVFAQLCLYSEGMRDP